MHFEIEARPYCYGKHRAYNGFFVLQSDVPDEVTCKRCRSKMLKNGFTQHSKWNKGSVKWYIRLPESKCPYINDTYHFGETPDTKEDVLRLITNSTTCQHPRNFENKCNQISCPIEV